MRFRQRHAAPATGQSIAASLESWRTLRQSSGYRFSDYAYFLITNPDWPDTDPDAGLGRKGDAAGRECATVLAFFAAEKPQTGNGWARLAEAFTSTGQAAQALDAARHAWASADLSPSDEQTLWARYYSNFTPADHDARVDALLFDKRPDDAVRFLSVIVPTVRRRSERASPCFGTRRMPTAAIRR